MEDDTGPGNLYHAVHGGGEGNVTFMVGNGGNSVASCVNSMKDR